MPRSTLETETPLFNELIANLGSVSPSKRLQARLTLLAQPPDRRARFLARLLEHQDSLRTLHVTTLPATLFAFLTSSLFIILGIVGGGVGGLLSACFGTAMAGVFGWDVLTRLRNFFPRRRYDAWLDTVRDARLAHYALPSTGVNIWDKDRCAMPSRAKLLKRLLPELTEADFRRWTREEHDRLFRLLDRDNAFFDVDLTVVLLAALPKTGDPYAPECLRRFANYSRADFLVSGPVERASAIGYGIERIREAARSVLPQDTLLRASSAPDHDAPKELLRPAASGEITPAEQLLRPLD